MARDPVRAPAILQGGRALGVCVHPSGLRSPSCYSSHSSPRYSLANGRFQKINFNVRDDGPFPEGGIDLRRRRERRQRPVSLGTGLTEGTAPAAGGGRPGTAPWPFLMERNPGRRPRRGRRVLLLPPPAAGPATKGPGLHAAVSGRWQAGPAHRDPFITHEARGQQRPPVNPRALSRSAVHARPRRQESGREPGQRGGHPLPTQRRSWWTRRRFPAKPLIRAGEKSLWWRSRATCHGRWGQRPGGACDSLHC